MFDRSYNNIQQQHNSLVTNPFIDVIVPRFLDSSKVSSSFFLTFLHIARVPVICSFVIIISNRSVFLSAYCSCLLPWLYPRSANNKNTFLLPRQFVPNAIFIYHLMNIPWDCHFFWAGKFFQNQSTLYMLSFKEADFLAKKISEHPIRMMYLNLVYVLTLTVNNNIICVGRKYNLLISFMGHS